MKVSTLPFFLFTALSVATGYSEDRERQLLRGTVQGSEQKHYPHGQIRIDIGHISRQYSDKCNVILGESISKAYAKVYDESDADEIVKTNMNEVHFGEDDLALDSGLERPNNLFLNFYTPGWYYFEWYCFFCSDDADVDDDIAYQDWQFPWPPSTGDNFLTASDAKNMEKKFLKELKALLLGSTCAAFEDISEVKISSYSRSVDEATPSSSTGTM